MTPSWYDVLDVDSTATDDAIRAAWRSAIADLDPTDRRFRLRNQAAEVLLDPHQRAAYDAELAAQMPEPEPEPEVATTVDLLKQPAEPATEAPTTKDLQRAPHSRRVVPGWLLAGVAVLTAAALGVAGWLWFGGTDESVETATRAAQSAAETAIVPILSYDANNLDEGQAAAQSYMTTDYQEKYDQLFAVIRENAPTTETVVTAQVLVSGIVRSGTNRVDVLIFVDRPTTDKLQKTPEVYKDQVTVTMEKVGNDWLVDDLTTSPAGG